MSHDPEFSRLLGLDEIDSDGSQCKIRADGEECAALARRFGILAVYGLSATLSFSKSTEGETVAVRGRLSARVEQKCTVSLDPFDENISAEIDQIFVRTRDRPMAIILDPEKDEAYDEIIEGNSIDIGEMVAQCLSLELDPYPRKPGVEYIQQDEIVLDSEIVSPFSALVRLQRKKE